MESHSAPYKMSELVRSMLVSFSMLIVSLFVNFYAGIYATEKASNPVTDIILSNTRAFDLDTLFIWASWGLVLLIAFLCFRRPSRAPFIMRSIALFVLIRAFFITMTHIGPFPTAAVINPQSFIRYFVFGGDLFFSGHTGLPFLMALLFWKEKRLRIAFILISIFLAVIVLLAHLHYTIDVLSAYFITYGIFHIALRLFKKERQMFVFG